MSWDSDKRQACLLCGVCGGPERDHFSISAESVPLADASQQLEKVEFNLRLP